MIFRSIFRGLFPIEKGKLCVVLVVALAGLSSVYPCWAGESAPWILQGRVVDENQRPLEGVTFELVKADSLRETVLGWLQDGHETVVAKGLSDRQGWYRVEAPEEGFFWLKARHPGRLSPAFRLSPLIEGRNIPPLRLPRSKSMKVTVKDPRGVAVEGAWVWVVSQGLPAVSRGLGGWILPQQILRTDRRGQVRPEWANRSHAFVRAWAYPFGEVEKKARAEIELKLKEGQARSLLIVDSMDKPVEGVVGLLGEVGFPVGPSDQEGRLRLSGREKAELSVVLLPQDGLRRQQTLPRKLPPTPEEKVVVEEPVDLSGRVVNSKDGREVDGALVAWIHETGDVGGWTRTRQGRFRLQTVTQETLIQASAKGFFSGFAQVRSSNRPIEPLSVVLHPSEILRGRVVGPEGQPVAGAEVTARVPRQKSRSLPEELSHVGRGTQLALTNEDGRFLVQKVIPDAEYDLRVRHFDWAETTKTAIPTRELDSPEIQIVMGKGSSVRGSVLNSTGEPIAGARLILRMSSEEPWMEPEPLTITHSDEVGSFQWSLLPEGPFDLELRATGYAPRTIRKLWASKPEVEWDAFVMEEGVRLEGRVADLEGRGLGGVAIVLRHDEGRRGPFRFFEGVTPTTFTDGYGAFAIEDLASGSRVGLTLELEGYGPAKVDWLSIPQVSSLEITMAPASMIEGRVVDGKGEPIVGAEVVLDTLEYGGSSSGSDDHVNSVEDGTFSFTGRAAGDYELAVSAQEYQSAQIRGIRLLPGQDLEGLEVVLKKGYSLEGVLYNEAREPVVGAVVWVYSSENFSRSMDRTSAGGRFRLDSLTLGPLIIAVESAGYARLEHPLELREGQGDIELVITEGVTLSGWVRSEAGEALSGARVRVFRSQTTQGEKESLTGSDGRFELKGVSAGHWRLQASSSGYATVDLGRELVLENRSVNDLELTLPIGADLQVQVRGLSGEELRLLDISLSRRDLGSAGRPRLVLDSQGIFRAANLGPGEWTLFASLAGRSESTSFTVGPGETEIFQELEFVEGLTLTGMLHSESHAFGGLRIQVNGRKGQGLGFATVDYQGRFAVKGLKGGQYDLQVLGTRRNLFTREVEFFSDHHVEIQLPVGGRVSGFVTDRSTGEPMASQDILLIRESPDTTYGHGILWAKTDSSGYFFLEDVQEGTWLLTVDARGYRTLKVPVEIDPGEVLEAMTLEMAPGLMRRVHLINSTGYDLNQVIVGFPDGSAAWIRLGPNDWLTLDNDFAESDTFLIFSPGLATAEVTLPLGQESEVVLGPEANLEVQIPELRTAVTEGTARLIAPSGAALRWLTLPPGIQDRIEVHQGTASFSSIPAGPWRVEVQTTDGRNWTKEFVAVAGESHTLVLP